MPAALEVAAFLRDEGGMRLIATHLDYAIAEKAVPGIPDAFRRVVVQWTPALGWRVAIALSEHVSNPAKYKNTRLAGQPFTTLEDLGLFVGGWMSKPVSPSEVAAIEQMAVSA